MDKELSWVNSAGGSMGRNDILKIGDDYVGHFYTDASEDVDAPEVLAEMARRYNAHAALVDALNDLRIVRVFVASVEEDSVMPGAKAATLQRIDAAILAASP